MSSSDPSAVITGHLNAARFAQAGIMTRLFRESGLFVALLVALSLLDLASDVVVSAHGLALFLLALLPSLALVAFGLWADRHEPEPAWLLMRCLIWGGTLSILVASVLNGLVSEAINQEVATSFGAPLVEETTKAVAIVWLLRHYRSHMNGRADAILYALFVGIGFTIVEDFQYYMQSYEDPDQALLPTVIVRAASTLLHPLFTAMLALGIVLGARREGPLRFLLPVAGFLAAVILHGMWNSDIPFELRAGLYLPLSFGLLLLVMKSNTTIDSERLARLMKAGTLSPRQVDALKQAVQAPKPGLIEWLSATRDPEHPYHLKWRILQLAWITTSPPYASHLARASGDPTVAVVSVVSEAARQLRSSLDQWIALHPPSPGR